MVNIARACLNNRHGSEYSFKDDCGCVQDEDGFEEGVGYIQEPEHLKLDLFPQNTRGYIAKVQEL